MEYCPYDPGFMCDEDGLKHAVDLLSQFLRDQQADATKTSPFILPESFPEKGIGDPEALNELAPLVLGQSMKPGSPYFSGHMDPPTPWITWASTLWNAALNQNLLHPATSPAAKPLEEKVIAWLAPFFGMSGGQMLPGSSFANLTALWAARDMRGVRRVLASEQAHISVQKAAHILGLDYHTVATDESHHLDANALGDLRNTALVLTAGTTSVGAIDDLSLRGHAAWVHVDAAWAGPLRLSEQYQDRLSGLQHADSVSVSAHKWLFQPKESALIFFRSWEEVIPHLSFGGNYLTAPNIGLPGSHGAVAVPLLATLLAWGRAGLSQRLDLCMRKADQLTSMISDDDRLILFAPPETGIVVWKPKHVKPDPTCSELQRYVSTVNIGGEIWLRAVMANPHVNIELMFEGSMRCLFDG